MNEESQIKPKERKSQDSLVLDLSGEEYRELREAEIEEELVEKFNYQAKDEAEISKLQAVRESEYQKAIVEIGDLPLSENSQKLIQQNLVGKVIEQAKNENVHYDELIREKKILDYLDRNLEGEERIAKPMDPACEVSVVIPVYGERDWIFRPLQSLVEQEMVESEQYEAIFVVNNKGEEPRRDIDESDADYQRKMDLFHQSAGEDGENQQVINILNHINGGKLKYALSSEEKKIVKALQKKGINIHVIDKASAGKTLPNQDANVGGARNRGVAEAVARFYEQKRANGIIGQTDSDSRLDKHYIRNMIDAFEKDPDLIGARGEMQFEQTENSEAFRKVLNFREMNYRYKRLLDYYFQKKNEEVGESVEETGRVAFSGANMMSRAYEAAIVDGVPKIAGGEDPEFGYRLAEIGDTKNIENIKTYPADRESARTAVWAGHGQGKIKAIEAFTSKGTIEADCLDYMRANEELRRNVIGLFKSGEANFDNLKKAFVVNNRQLLSDEDIKRVEKMVAQSDNMKDIGNTDERLEIGRKYQEAIRKMYPKKPIDEAAFDLVQELCESNEIGPKFKAIYGEMAKKEDDWAKSRQERMNKMLDIVFLEERGDYSEESMLKFLKSHKESLDLDLEAINNIKHERHILIRLVESINQAENKTEAMDNLKMVFADELSLVDENHLKKRMLELRAMHQAKRELNNTKEQ